MKLYFTLENEKMPIDYRRSIISFIKLSLSEYYIMHLIIKKIKNFQLIKIHGN